MGNQSMRVESQPGPRSSYRPECQFPVVGANFGATGQGGNPGNAVVRFSAVQSTLTLAALIIGHHFAISAFCQVPSASGVSLSFGGICSPRFSSCLRTAGSFRASTAAALSFATTSFGVSLGTQRPDHNVM